MKVENFTLKRTCDELAKEIASFNESQNKGPKNEGKSISESLYNSAVVYTDVYDPETVCQAVRYLIYTFSNPFTGSDISWFNTALKIVFEIAYPNVIQLKDNAKFLNTMMEGIKRSIASSNI